MSSRIVTTFDVEPELRAEIESVADADGPVSTSAADGACRAVERCRVQGEFYARGDIAWQEYLRTGVSHPVAEVFDRIQARIDARRRELQDPNTWPGFAGLR